MKRTLCLLVLSLALGACGPAYVSVGPAYPADPGYVYTYADGGCWGDDVWYPACPWYTGPQAGYYYRYQSHYYIRPGIVWQHRHRPPPRVRDHRPPSRHHMVPPPRARDHRHRHRR